MVSYCFQQDSNRNHLRIPPKEDSLKIQENPSGDSVFSDQKQSRSSKDDTAFAGIKKKGDIFPSFTPSLKRKRPPKLHIPAVLQEVSAAKLRCRDRVDDEFWVEFEGAQCWVFCKKGKKEVMEDTHKIVSELKGNSKKGFFGVYDGHGGRKAAEFVAENLHLNILGMLENFGGNLRKEDAIKAGYLKTDQEFLKQGVSSGACCVTALIEDSNIVVSNLGDCRAVVCRGGIAEALTVDHRAGRQDERNRIEEQGGYVDVHHGAWRVQGVLAVSRSIGDLHLKQWVLAEPDTRTLPLTSDMDFLILASDGLWDKVGNQEASDIAMNFHPSTNNQANRFDCFEKEQLGSKNMSPLKARRISSNNHLRSSLQCPNQETSHHKNNPKSTGGLMEACKELVGLAASRGSLDDITVMIIDLKHFHCS